MLSELQNTNISNILSKKKKLELLINEDRETFDRLLKDFFRTETTYSSNAIEGNTLSKIQTDVVINKGITISGKSIVEHLEAINHARAYDFVISGIENNSTLTERFIMDIQGIILENIDNKNSGRYRNMQVRISGSSTILPNYQKVPTLMEKFIEELKQIETPILQSLFAHYAIVTIHPFSDGNGRTARLVANFILMKNGYSPIIINKKDRLKYLKSLEMAQTRNLNQEYINFMLKCIEKSIDFSIKNYNKDSKSYELQNSKLIKIGELSRLSGASISTIRYWIKSGILNPTETTESGYQLFNLENVNRIAEIIKLKKQRFRIDEIASRLS
jgi:Fic family protein